jgi:hypothetical protein
MSTFARRLPHSAALAIAMALPFAAQGAFKDAHDTPPAGWMGPVFKLSQSYPATLPTSAADTAHPWTSCNFKTRTGARQYLKAVLQYCFEGNLNTAMPNDSFADVGTNSVRKWYHAPWLDDGAKGREFIHGLTKERPSRPGELGSAQTTQHDNWAVGFYNPLGGYVIGRVWKNESEPDPGKASFPEGSVSCKLIFTTTPVSQAPFLDGSLTWQADVNRSRSATATRPDVRLLQIDVAIKDNRAGPPGWVFGTFEYSKNGTSGTSWSDHLVPVGLMWGNDVTDLIAKKQSKAQQINATRNPSLHLGYRGLLNGPIDNPNASCMGCHGAAQIALKKSPQPSLPSFSSSTPSATASATVLHKDFDDVPSGHALSADYASLDYSLQLQAGIANALKEHAAHLPAGIVPAAAPTHAAGPAAPTTPDSVPVMNR